MRAFVLHTLVFFAAQLALLVWVWRWCPSDPDHYMAATIDKHVRLHDAATPRLVLVGGSSVGFGVDSRAFVDAGLGLDPVNMGLNAQLGLPFMLAEVERELAAGDVVILAPETHLFWTGSQDDAIWAVLQHRPANLACLSGAHARELSDQALHFVARKVRCALHQATLDTVLATIYRRSSFDRFGDFVAHRDLPRRDQPALDEPWPALRDDTFVVAVDAVRRFLARCDEVGARCYGAWMPTRQDVFARHHGGFERLDAELRAVGLRMLESPDEVALPEAAFFDRGPHLTGEAAAERSRRLAQRLAQ